MGRNDLKTNGSGYSDPTAYEAMLRFEKENEDFEKLLRTIFNICELSGFHIEERIVIRSKKTGRIWR